MFCEDKYSQIIYTMDGSPTMHVDGTGVPDVDDDSRSLANPAVKLYSHAEYPSVPMSSHGEADAITFRALAICRMSAAHDSREAVFVLPTPKVAEPILARRSDAAKAALLKLGRPELILRNIVPQERGRQAMNTLLQRVASTHDVAADTDAGWSVDTFEVDAVAKKSDPWQSVRVLDAPALGTDGVDDDDAAEDAGGYLSILAHTAGGEAAESSSDMSTLFGGSGDERKSVANPLLENFDLLSVPELWKRYHEEDEAEQKALADAALAKILDANKGTAVGDGSFDALHPSADSDEAAELARQRIEEVHETMERLLSALSVATQSDEVEINLLDDGDCFFTVNAAGPTSLDVVLDRSDGKKIGVLLGDAPSPSDGVAIAQIDKQGK